MVTVEAFAKDLVRLVERSKKAIEESEYMGVEFTAEVFGAPCKVFALDRLDGVLQVEVKHLHTGAPLLTLTVEKETGRVGTVKASL